MGNIRRPVNVHEIYHAHVYFDRGSADSARQLCADIGLQFGLRVGRFHQKLVGPHPCWSCQIEFAAADFERFVPWLEQQRQDLNVFIHGVTGDNLKDHTDYAYWLGDSAALNLRVFEQN